MPLIKSKSKKAFSHNVEAEMKSGKPQDQSLAIAYSVKRKPKKMASGGAVNESAKSEHRPMPEERDKDSAMVSRNSGNKPPMNDSMTSRPDIVQSQRGPRTQPIKHPKMVPSNAFSTRLYNYEDELLQSAKPNEGPQEQPAKYYDEEGADRQGPDTPSLHMKRMARGGPIMEPRDEGIELMERSDEADMQSRLSSSQHGEQPKGQYDEEGPNRQGPDVSDMEREHNNGRKPYAQGGPIDRDEKWSVVRSAGGHGNIFIKDAEGGMIENPDIDLDEMEDERHSSIAAAIMAKRQKMADGGILSHDSIYSDESDQADLSRNADEDANEEDQLSFNALRKENYSESEGLEQLDSPMDSNEHGHDIDSDRHDMVSRIRSKMKSRRQF